MGQQIEKLAAFAAKTRWEDIPAAVQKQAKLVFLDTFGVILAGSVRPEVAQLRDRLASTAGTGATVYAKGAPAHDPRTAALTRAKATAAISTSRSKIRSCTTNSASSRDTCSRRKASRKSKKA